MSIPNIEELRLKRPAGTPTGMVMTSCECNDNGACAFCEGQEEALSDARAEDRQEREDELALAAEAPPE